MSDREDAFNADTMNVQSGNPPTRFIIIASFGCFSKNPKKYDIITMWENGCMSPQIEPNTESLF